MIDDKEKEPEVVYNPFVQLAFVFGVFAVLTAFIGMLVMMKALFVVGSL